MAFDSSSGDRRAFFRLGLGQLLSETAKVIERTLVGDSAPLRPPGALPEAAFVAACTRCGECAKVCPVGAIVTLPTASGLAAGTPSVDPMAIACVACVDMPCTRACPTGALTLPERGWRDVKWGTVRIDPNRCIAHRDVECGVCARVCPIGPDALRMQDQLPVVGDACVGCGSCISACVTTPSSITFTRTQGAA